MNEIFCEDCLETLKRMDSESINCVITSPPYYGLRDYGVDGQIGLESTPEEYVSKLVEIFREIRRVLKKDGTVWLNLGDSYASGKSRYSTNEQTIAGGGQREEKYGKMHRGGKPDMYYHPILKDKDLIGIPWRVAFALQADGWWLRQDIIWHKPNPMPESVTDRCTKAHEYIFLLTKSASYYYDAEAIKEKANYYAIDKRSDCGNIKYAGKRDGTCNAQQSFVTINEFANKRSVWTVTTKPFKEAHFATFPEDLIKPCVLAGCPENGVIYDPFMGAGTTAFVAFKYHRNFIGSEINPEYIKLANKRIAEMLQQYKLDFK